MKKLIVIGLMLLLISCADTSQRGLELVREKFPNSKIYYEYNRCVFIVIDSNRVMKVRTGEIYGKTIEEIQILMEDGKQ